CTAPLFLIQVVGSFTREGVVGGLLTYLAYAVGMGSVIVFLTIGLAVARGGIARNMRRVLPYVNRVSGALLVLAGIYLALYGWWEVRVLRDPINTPENRLQKWFTDFQTDISNWISDVGPGRIGLFLVGSIAVVVVSTQMYRRSRAVDDETKDRVSAE
ncbi:MAG: cytochrome c biogenesis protein CcdA, partial [Acidimicrobiales bacterium]